jgi:hypothetical protein
MMFINGLVTILVFQTLLTNEHQWTDATHLNGHYHMSIPNDGYQYVFHIDWSDYFHQYLVTVIGQPLAWATARMNMVNETTVNLICDTGMSSLGTITYVNDMPSICAWSMSTEFTCWNRLLSNVTRIHVINM